MEKEISIIQSKSYGHRALICRFLAEEEMNLKGGAIEISAREDDADKLVDAAFNSCNIEIAEKSKDIIATEKCLKEMSQRLRSVESTYHSENSEKDYEAELQCGESGSTLRFLLPIVGALGIRCRFKMEGKLGERPLSPLKEELEKKGMTIEKKGEYLHVRGRLKSGEFNLAGNVSSQYFSGLLMALPMLKQASKINVIGQLESKSYVDITLSVMRDFGVDIESVSDEAGNYRSFIINGEETYSAPKEYQVEGDWSNAAFWIVLGTAIEEGIAIRGLNRNSIQGDMEIINLIKKMGGKICFDEEDRLIIRKSLLKGIEIDAKMIPDMVPALAAAATTAVGKTEISGAERLRIKESDRLHAVAENINSLGGKAMEKEDGLTVFGKDVAGEIEGGNGDSFNDHRIAMMCGIMSINSKKPIIIKGSDACQKSYGSFFEKLIEICPNANLILK